MGLVTGARCLCRGVARSNGHNKNLFSLSQLCCQLDSRSAGQLRQSPDALAHQRDFRIDTRVWITSRCGFNPAISWGGGGFISAAPALRTGIRSSRMLHAGAELEVTGERAAAAETPMLIEENIDERRIVTSFSSRPPLPSGAKPAYAAQADARARRATRWDEITLGLQRARQRREGPAGINAALTSRPSRKLRRELSPLVPR